jgi:5-formyltetrahydrofolate cyclo-ligase
MNNVERAQISRHKQVLRGFYREAVLAFPPARRARLSRRLADRLAALREFRLAQTVGLYVALPHEPDSSPLLDLCRRMGKAVAVPVTNPQAGRIDFSLLETRTPWSRNVYGIREPSRPGRRLLDPRNIELLVVPGRAFTRDGGRLGSGAGYYDRFLAEHPWLFTVGAAFDEQVARRLPRGSFDAAVSAVVTPTRMHRPR